MITKLSFLHYLPKETYQAVCHVLGLDDSDHRNKGNDITFTKGLIARVHAFNIVYEAFGHIWFMNVDTNLEYFPGSYEDYAATLYSEYIKLFGAKAMVNFPTFDQLSCGYAEYANIIAVASADKTIQNMAAMGCPPQQLDESRWASFKKPNATIEFCVSKLDATHLKTLARCHGTALKKRIKDSAFHITTGIAAPKMLEMQIEIDIVQWLYAKYKIDAAV